MVPAPARSVLLVVVPGVPPQHAGSVLGGAGCPQADPVAAGTDPRFGVHCQQGSPACTVLPASAHHSPQHGPVTGGFPRCQTAAPHSRHGMDPARIAPVLGIPPHALCVASQPGRALPAHIANVMVTNMMMMMIIILPPPALLLVDNSALPALFEACLLSWQIRTMAQSPAPRWARQAGCIPPFSATTHQDQGASSLLGFRGSPNISAPEGGKHKLQLRCALGQKPQGQGRVPLVSRRVHSGWGDTSDAPASGRNQHPQAAAGAWLPVSLSWHFALPSPACAKASSGSGFPCRAGHRGWPRQDRTCTRPCRSATHPAPLEVSPALLGCCGQEQAAG